MICWEQNKGGKNVLENKAIGRRWGLSAVAFCLFLSTRSPSRLENTHCSPRHSTPLTANLLIHLWHYVFDLCRLSRSLGSNDSNNRHASHHWFPADTVSPGPVEEAAFAGFLQLKFSAFHSGNETGAKGCHLLFWSCVWKVSQNFKWDHTVICTFSSISRGLTSLLLEV